MGLNSNLWFLLKSVSWTKSENPGRLLNNMVYFWRRTKEALLLIAQWRHTFNEHLRDFLRGNYLHLQDLKRKTMFLKPCNNFTIMILYQETDEEVYTSSEVHWGIKAPGFFCPRGLLDSYCCSKLPVCKDYWLVNSFRLLKYKVAIISCSFKKEAKHFSGCTVLESNEHYSTRGPSSSPEKSLENTSTTEQNFSRSHVSNLKLLHVLFPVPMAAPLFWTMIFISLPQLLVLLRERSNSILWRVMKKLLIMSLRNNWHTWTRSGMQNRRTWKYW